MAVLSDARAYETQDRRGQILGRDTGEGRIARRAPGNKRATVGRAGRGERRRRRMRAALGAARNMDRGGAVEERRNRRGDIRSHGARGDMSGAANRRSGASDNTAPRVVGPAHKAEFLRGGGKLPGSPARDPDGQQRAAGRGAKAAGAGGSRDLSQLFK